LLVGTSILISETEESIKSTAERFFKNKLREKLLLEMEQTKKQFNLKKMVLESLPTEASIH
jgi:hypothetical protein